MDESVGRKNKWEAYAERVDTTTPSKLATFELTVKRTLDLLGDCRAGQLLDIGCGFGEIDILLAKNTTFSITANDISEICVKRAKELVSRSGMNSRIRIEYGDVYNLPYPRNFFDVVTSFGYASAATYKGAQGEIWRVLKPNGLLICDFINALSIYKFFKVAAKWKKAKEEVGKEYNFFTTEGIKEYFQRYHLTFQCQRFFNTYPPVNFFPKRHLLFFEDTLGQLSKRFLGRVRLVCFRKTEEN